MITLYHSKDTRSLRCLWLLEELDVPREVEMVAFPPQLKQPGYLETNPNGTVPFLVDGQTRMRESGAMLLYIANRYGEGRCLVDSGSLLYGAMLDWTFYGETALTVSLSTALRYSMLLPREQRIPAVSEDYRAQMLRKLQVLEQALESGTYLCGDELTVADISVGYGLLLGEMFALGEQYPPQVNAYLQRLKARPAFIRARTYGA
ncbi:glutathione S-transferase family protein [Pseudomonas sp. NFACC13-1]|uniref:glutathione S-transferase family protein n=1 Tax=Pseudomonas sp. NFACC13-1 TaxID=1566245 RepID=UPI00088ED2B9|nr:glutathione S-transferase family protein [Pseudomonas sp. NFACC13-1]SDB35064.1 Glutathione S-transferase [Pseudomonas sp. NFACC13-1]